VTPTTASLTEKAANQAGIVVQAVIQKARKLVDACATEFGKRLQNAQQAFESEMNWQQAQRTEAKPLAMLREETVGLLISPLGTPIPLKEGLNALQGIVLRIENGEAVLIDSASGNSRRLYTGDSLRVGDHTQTLKLFIRDHLATSTRIGKEAP